MYDYRRAVREDVLDYINNEVNFEDFESIEELEEKLNDDLWCVDSVTGNASGSYTFNSFKAREYVLDNFDLLREMAEEFGEVEEAGKKLMSEEWEWCDVSIRCYILGSAISEALEEIADDFEEAHEEAEEE